MVILNGQAIQEEELQKIREKLKDSKEERLVEVAPNTYRILSKLDE